MKTNLLFGIHCHQPIDNFDEVVLSAIAKSYKPFFQTLEEFPKFKCSVHFSGWLLEFIEKKDAELFSLIQKLSPQLEFFSGGFYEPILASIPSADRISQIKKLNTYIKKKFNQTPKGLWLTERVWDNSIISDLKKCGIEYVIVDDYHFIASGYDEKNLNGYFLTEEGGEKIGLFPISQTLRYMIPFGKNSEVNEIIKAHENSAIIFDDGEKFGVWPKTYESVYEKGWLRDFFKKTLGDKKIKVEFFRDFYEKQKPISLAYLPTVSYMEMGEWSLKAKDSLRLEELKALQPQTEKFLKGGIWKNFLTKYQEANWIHKRVLELSKKQTKLKENREEFQEALYKSQCNDVLWHGVFGGIYLPNLRDNAYHYIIECENLLYKQNHNESLDIDFDGELEYKFHTDSLLTILSQKGQILELDIKDKCFNLQNTLTRYEEAYHSKIQKITEKNESSELETIHDNRLEVEEDISLDYDWYLKKSAIEHFSDESFTMESFKKANFNEYGDFANQNFKTETFGKKIKFSKNGGIYRDKKYSSNIQKEFNFKNNKISVGVSFDTKYKKSLKYINEWNLHFPNIKNIKISGQILEDDLKIFSNELIIEDEILDKTIKFKFDRKIEIFIYALNTISQSEEGVDIMSQGITFGTILPFKEKFNFNYSFICE